MHPRNQIQAELAAIRAVIRRQEEMIARREHAGEHVSLASRTELPRLRDIARRLAAIELDIAAAADLARAERIRQGVG